jgi:hypothetical protein
MSFEASALLSRSGTSRPVSCASVERYDACGPVMGSSPVTHSSGSFSAAAVGAEVVGVAVGGVGGGGRRGGGAVFGITHDPMRTQEGDGEHLFVTPSGSSAGRSPNVRP